MKKNGYMLALAICTGCSAPVQSSGLSDEQPLNDEWETPRSSLPSAEDCGQIETVLIHPVSPSLRDQGIALLSDVSLVELSDEDAARLIDVPNHTHVPLATALVAAELDELRARRHRAVVERKDSWTGGDEVDLAALSSRYDAGDYQSFRPYLVRAVAKNEGTGGFYASLCKSDLRIEHGSLGHSIPPSTRVPLVVFLRQPPQRVFVTWGMAE